MLKSRHLRRRQHSSPRSLSKSHRRNHNAGSERGVDAEHATLLHEHAASHEHATVPEYATSHEHATSPEHAISSEHAT